MPEADSPLVQWAAVMIQRSLMRVPPHQTLVPRLLTIPACQGYSLTSVTCPPTILVLLFANPHLQSDSEEPPLPEPLPGDVGTSDPDPGIGPDPEPGNVPDPDPGIGPGIGPDPDPGIGPGLIELEPTQMQGLLGGDIGPDPIPDPGPPPIPDPELDPAAGATDPFKKVTFPLAAFISKV